MMHQYRKEIPYLNSVDVLVMDVGPAGIGAAVTVVRYGALVPKGVENLLTSGRCISGTHRAHASYRVMAICMRQVKQPVLRQH